MRLLFGTFLVFLTAPVWGAMPAAEQNALVKQYCAVCHTDKAMNGGLSLEHFDAAKRDPGLAAMMLSKLNDGAMGAAGNGVPNQAAQQAWLESTREQAVGAKEWFVTREAGVVTAGIVQDVAPRKPGSTDSPVYRLRLTCNLATAAGEVQLTWSPEPQTGRSVLAIVDDAAPIEHKIEGRESMGNGATAQSGRASLLLRGIGLPNASLAIRELFPGESVQFSFTGLPQAARADLGKCF